MNRRPQHPRQLPNEPRVIAISQAPQRLPYAPIAVAFGLLMSVATAVSMPWLIG